MSTLGSTWPYERLERMRDEMNDLIEMLEILLDRELLDSIERGKEDIKEGRIYTLQEFKKMVKE